MTRWCLELSQLHLGIFEKGFEQDKICGVIYFPLVFLLKCNDNQAYKMGVAYKCKISSLKDR